MLLRSLRFVLIAALLIDSGAHLAALQTYAWASMAATNLKTFAFIQAVETALDGQHQCAVCMRIGNAGKSQNTRQVNLPDLKVDFYCQVPERVAAPANSSRLEASLKDALPTPQRSPAVPPPKSLLA